MVRVAMVILGVALLLMGTLGLGGESSLAWVRVFSILFGLASVFLAFQVNESSSDVLRTGLPLVFTGGLLLLWLFALVGGAPNWQAWGTFGVAVVYAMLGLAEKLGDREQPPVAPVLPLRKRA